MSTDEMRKFIQFIFDQMESVKAELRNANNTIARNAEEQKRSNEEILSLTKRLYEVLNELEASLSKKIELKYFKYLNEYNVFTYDTMRFFRYKNDQIKTIDSSEINVIELALKQG